MLSPPTRGRPRSCCTLFRAVERKNCPDGQARGAVFLGKGVYEHLGLYMYEFRLLIVWYVG